MLTLARALDLQAASPLRAWVLAHRGLDLDLDASQVGQLGGLCLQVLLSARQTWAQDERVLRIVEPSEACRTAARLTQTAGALGLQP